MSSESAAQGVAALGLFPPVPGPLPGATPGGAARRVARWAAALALLPIPLWFLASAALAPAPAWRAEYREHAGFAGAGAVLHERELQRYWDKSNPALPGGLSFRSFAARWDTCLTLREARDVPFMLAVDGDGRFDVDGAERLRAQSVKSQRSTRGSSLRLEAGTHHLHVELEARGRPSIALLASFDGHAPRAIGSGEIAPGVHTRPPLDASNPCQAE